MHFKLGFIFCLMTTMATAADLDLQLKTGLQVEKGGDQIHNDQVAHTAFQVNPTFIWAWNYNRKMSSDVRFSPAIDIPAYAGSALSNVHGEWRLRYAYSGRTQLESRFYWGQAAFDETTQWKNRTRISGDLGLSTTLTSSLYMLSGYTYATSHYNVREPETNQTQTTFPQTSWPNFGRGAQAASSDLSDASTLDQAATAPNSEDRTDHRHRIRTSLMWIGSRYWLTGGGSLEHNQASIPTYGYQSAQFNMGGGIQYRNMGFNLQNSHEWRRYHLQDGTTSIWRSLWVSAEATWRVKPYMQAFANIQKEYGYQNGQQTFAPWTLTSVGLKFDLPLKKKNVRSEMPREPLKPYPIKTGWIFRYRNDQAQSVHLIGTFSNWDSDKYALKRVPKTDMWEITIPLQPGVYEYAFIINGETWVTPPQAPLYVDDGFGKRNGVLVVEKASELTARE